jgi:hypothetical protein
MVWLAALKLGLATLELGLEGFGLEELADC